VPEWPPLRQDMSRRTWGRVRTYCEQRRRKVGGIVLSHKVLRHHGPCHGSPRSHGSQERGRAIPPEDQTGRRGSSFTARVRHSRCQSAPNASVPSWRCSAPSGAVRRHSCDAVPGAWGHRRALSSGHEPREMRAMRPPEAEPYASTRIDRGELSPWLGVDSSKRPSVEGAVTGRRRTRGAAVGAKLHSACLIGVAILLWLNVSAKEKVREEGGITGLTTWTKGHTSRGAPPTNTECSQRREALRRGLPACSARAQRGEA
jgi:hypothetical protein